MQFKAFFLLCALQAVQFASAQCGCGPVVAPAPACNTGYPAYPGYPAPAPVLYPLGDIDAAGTLPVTGPVSVDGLVPVEGSVNYAGDVDATGTASVYCSCGNKWA